MASDDHAASPPIVDGAQREHPVEKVAGRVPRLTNADRAQLRRIYLTGRHEADGIVIGLLHRADVTITIDPAVFRPWRLLVHCAALLAGTGKIGVSPHARRNHLGAVLHDVGFAENRLLRLTSARGSVLDALVIRTMMRVARSGKGPVNLLTLFDLIGNDDHKAETARLRIARDFYAAKAKLNKGDDE